MVDLFAVNDFIRFLKNQYPEIYVSVEYDPVNFVLTIRFCYQKNDYHYYTVRRFIYDTKSAIGAICYHQTAFLLDLERKGVNLNER